MKVQAEETRKALKKMTRWESRKRHEAGFSVVQGTWSIRVR